MHSDDHPIVQSQTSDIGALSVVTNTSSPSMDALPNEFNLLSVVSFLKQNEERYLSLQLEEEPATTEHMFKPSARGNVQKAIQYYKQVQRHKHSMSKSLLNYNKNRIKSLIQEVKAAEALGILKEALRIRNIVEEVISKVKKFLTDNNELNEQDREQLQTCLLIVNDFCNTQRIFINKSMTIIERLKFQGNYVALLDKEDEIKELKKATDFFDKLKSVIIELEGMDKDLQDLNNQLSKANTIKPTKNRTKSTIKLSPEAFPSHSQQVENLKKESEPEEESELEEESESEEEPEKYKVLLKKLNEKKATIVRQKLDLNFWKKTITAKTEELVAQIKDALVYKKENSAFMKDSLKSKIQKTKQIIQDKYLTKIAKIESNLEWLEKYSKKKKSLKKNYDVIRASWQRQIAIIREQETEECSNWR